MPKYLRRGILAASKETIGSKPLAPLVLPLIGRRTDRRSSNWHYKTYNDTRIPLALAVWDVEAKRDCMKKNGCGEFVEGMLVNVPPYGTYVVDMDNDD